MPHRPLLPPPPPRPPAIEEMIGWVVPSSGCSIRAYWSLGGVKLVVVWEGKRFSWVMQARHPAGVPYYISYLEGCEHHPFGPS